MTDPIRIPIRYGIDNTTHATITPDIARQIYLRGKCETERIRLESERAQALIAADKPAPSGPCDPDESSNHVCEKGTHGCTVTHQPAGDDAAEQLRCWAVGYEYYYDAYFGPDAPFGDQQPTAAALAEALQSGARIACLAMREKDVQIADLRAKLESANQAAIRQEDAKNKALERVAERERHLQGERDCSEQRRSERDKALDDLAAMTERAERSERETVEAIRQKDICRINVVKLRDRLAASKNGHWYGRMITAETRAADLKHERDAARADADALRKQVSAIVESSHQLPLCIPNVRHGPSVFDETIAEYKAIRAERDALTARKVTMPKHFTVSNFCQPCVGLIDVISAIRAAGVGVAE